VEKKFASIRSPTAGLIFAVLVWAVCLRIAALPLATGRVLSGDPANYVNIARNVLGGDGLMRSYSPLTEGMRAYYPPVYPLLLAAGGLVAPLSPPTYAFINLLIDIAAAFAIVWLATAIGLSRTVGFIGAAIYVLWPTNILMTPVPQKEGLSTLLALLALGFLVKRNPVGFGVVSGILALTQPALVTFPALAALLLHWREGWLRFVFISASIAVAILLPWWIRNYVLFGQFVPLTTASGMNFWVGTMGNGMAYLPEVEKFTRYPEIDRSAAAFREAFAYIAAHPLDYSVHTIRKAATVFQGDLWGTKPLFWMKPLKPGGFWLREVPYVLSFVLLGLAALGMIIAKNRTLKLIVLACLIQLFAVQIWFQFSERHRYFMVPILILIAVEGAYRVAPRLMIGRELRVIRTDGLSQDQPRA